jgi:hypothetical protein
MTLVDNAVYVGGRRTANPANLDETYELLGERNGMAWIGLYRPMSMSSGRWRGSSDCTTWLLTTRSPRINVPTRAVWQHTVRGAAAGAISR